MTNPWKQEKQKQEKQKQEGQVWILIKNHNFLFVFCLLVFCFIIMGYPQECFLKVLWRFDLICLIYCAFKKCLFVCLLVCFIDYLNHLGLPTGSFPENFVTIWLNLTEILLIHTIVLCMCVFVCLFVCFCINHLPIPTQISSESFVKIWLDLAEILSINKIVFFVYWLNHLGIPKNPKITWISDLLWLKYCQSIKWKNRMAWQSEGEGKKEKDRNPTL